jgi:hypothetical protein
MMAIVFAGHVNPLLKENIILSNKNIKLFAAAIYFLDSISI